MFTRELESEHGSSVISTVLLKLKNITTFTMYMTACDPRELRGTFTEVWELERLQTLKVTQGHWYRCHAIGQL